MNARLRATKLTDVELAIVDPDLFEFKQKSKKLRNQVTVVEIEKQLSNDTQILSKILKTSMIGQVDKDIAIKNFVQNYIAEVRGP